MNAKKFLSENKEDSQATLENDLVYRGLEE